MNKDKFNEITVEVIDSLIDDMHEKGISTEAAFAAMLTITLFAGKLTDKLFEETDSLEIEKER